MTPLETSTPTNNDQLQRNYQAPGRTRVSYLAYADDLMIFTTLCRQNMELLRDFLRAYEQVSGQLINGMKSFFIVGRQVSSLQTQAVQNVLGYQPKHLLVMYLGVPLYKGNIKACLFDSIISWLRDMLRVGIPVDASMKRKGFNFPSKCQCYEAEETISHLFVEITAVQGVWQHFDALFGLCPCDTGSLTHMRNAAKYRGVQFPTDGIILKVQRHLRTLYATPTLTSTQWKGDLHQFKLNTDGFSLGNRGLAGAADIIRDSDGNLHLVYQVALGTGTSVIAKLTAVWRGLEFTLAHGLAPLVVEVDAITAIHSYSLVFLGSGRYNLIMRIIHIQQLLVSDIQHVFREANGAADHLVKETASLQLTRVLRHDDITGVFREILCLDKWEIPHLRRGR
ncbi:UNVERIFIED_CONTAM: putative ribonuclease H protein [Sesamum calycinum]|uniref:Ribonuclease H protein n=1 Tax=Sesamum calycinum TaxID=2727403 RepID=A0AAW2SVC2_9LAMI